MKKIISRIPGFRTGVLWKKIIAVIGYVFMLITLLSAGLDGITIRDKIIHLCQVLIGLGIPYILLTNLSGVRDRLPLFNKKRPLYVIAGLLAALIVLTGSITVLAQFESPQQKEANRIAQQQRELQTVVKERADKIDNKAANKSQNEPGDNQETAAVSDENNQETDNVPAIAEIGSQPDNQQGTETPPPVRGIQDEQKDTQTMLDKQDTEPAKLLKVHFIDVGQADSILVQTPSGKVMLVDAGNNADGDAVVSYIKSQGINKIDVLVGTHPHEDHIGGMDTVVNSFNIGKVYMPRATTTTKTYEDVLTAISRKGLKISAAKGGMTIDIDPAVKVDILAPNSSAYEDLNNYSIVLKLTYKNTSFLLAGDAEDISEQEMLARGYNLRSDVLKVGHHGSDSSTTPAFLKAVSPKYAVISVGKDNDYGHPAPETINKLTSAGVEIYRTDEAGTIVATSDGNAIRFDKKASPVKPQAPPAGSAKPAESKVSGTAKNGGSTGSIKVVNITRSVKAGSNASITIQGTPGVEYDITVVYSSGPSQAAGLEPKTAGSDGRVTWTWKVGSRTKPGTYPITINGGGKTIEAEFEVVK